MVKRAVMPGAGGVGDGKPNSSGEVSSDEEMRWRRGGEDASPHNSVAVSFEGGV